jgi:hypothetical protein
MPRYFIDPTTTDDKFLKIDGSRASWCIQAPPWTAVDPGTNLNELLGQFRPYFEGTEEGFLRKCARDAAAVQARISRNAF